MNRALASMLVFLIIFFIPNISFAKYGKGELKLDKITMEHFLTYLYGAGSANLSESKKQRSFPLVFSVSADGSMSHYYYTDPVCEFQNCGDFHGSKKKSILKCEKDSKGSPCFTLAFKRRIVWKNGGKKLKIKKKDLKSPYRVAQLIQEAGFYDGDISKLAGIDMKTGRIDTEIKITGEANTTQTSSNNTTTSDDLLKQLESLKKLYNDGVLSKEEFTKAKNKLLNQ